MPQSSISKILRGDSETSRHAGKIAAALGVSADWLINGTGSIYGDSNQPLQAIDVSKNVKVYDFDGFTGDYVSWFSELPEHFRAYIIKGRTGIAQAPAGAIVIVDQRLLQPLMTWFSSDSKRHCLSSNIISEAMVMGIFQWMT